MHVTQPPPGDPAPRMARARGRLGLFREAAEICLGHARELKVGAPRAACACARRDPAEVCGRLSRHVRLALIEEGRIENEIAALKPKPVVATVSDLGFDLPPPPPKSPNSFRYTLVDEIYKAVHGMIAGEDNVRGVTRALVADLADGDRYDAFLDLPFEAAARAICKDIGIDWDVWAEAVRRSEEEARAENDANPWNTPPDPADWAPTVWGAR